MVFQNRISTITADRICGIRALQIHHLKSRLRIVLRFPAFALRRQPILQVYGDQPLLKLRDISQNLSAALRYLRKRIRDYRKLLFPALFHFFRITVLHTPERILRFIQPGFITNSRLLFHHTFFLRHITVILQSLPDRIIFCKTRHPYPDIPVYCCLPGIRLRLLPFPHRQIKGVFFSCQNASFHNKLRLLFLRYAFFHDRKRYHIFRCDLIPGSISTRYLFRPHAAHPVDILFMPVHQNIFRAAVVFVCQCEDLFFRAVFLIGFYLHSDRAVSHLALSGSADADAYVIAEFSCSGYLHPIPEGYPRAPEHGICPVKIDHPASRHVDKRPIT